jgi:hypothetical protein
MKTNHMKMRRKERYLRLQHSLGHLEEGMLYIVLSVSPGSAHGLLSAYVSVHLDGQVVSERGQTGASSR